MHRSRSTGPATTSTLLALAVTAWACSGDDASPLGVTEEFVGPAGGTVQAVDGRARVAIPPGALDEPTRITVTRLTEDEVPPSLAGRRPVSDVYLFGPHDLRFLVPARVQITFDDADLPEGLALEDLTLVKLEEDVLVELATVQVLDPGGGAGLAARRGVSGLVTRFSPFAVVVDETAGSPPIVTAIEFPETHSNDPGSQTVGAIRFADLDGDVVRVIVEETFDPDSAFQSFVIEDARVLGRTEGTIGFRIFCPEGPTPCRTGPVGAEVVLEDAAGYASEPAELSFEIVD